MLPSRLFRNLGIPASLHRNAARPYISLRFTPRAAAALSLNLQHRTHSGIASSSVSPPIEQTSKLEQQPRYRMTFSCTAPVSEGVVCNHRSTHEFTKQAYHGGIVLVQCPKCQNRHLIADHLGWFEDSTENGKLRTVEDLMKAKGEKVRRGKFENGETLEYFE